ncbi:MAG: glycosyltransferase family 4 protein [bacterium]|nr:glycosyltransferase family 4 protein [bacterium]
MKILLITPACHFTNAGAAQRDIYAAITTLQKLNFEVAVYSIDSAAQDRATLKSVADKYKIDLRTFLPPKNNWSRFKSVLTEFSLFDGAAYVFKQLCLDKKFLGFLRDFQPNRVFSFCSYSWPVLELAKTMGIHSVFRSHNFESDFFWESLNIGQKFNPLNWLRVGAKYLGEKKAVIYSSAVASLPFEQMKKYQAWKKENVQILTLFFLPESLRAPAVHAGKQSLDLFFLGASYNVIFHLRGAELLIEQIAPRVLALAAGKFRFHICGSKLPQRLVDKCKDGIIYEGYVENLEEFLSSMDAGVFPVMTGKTMKGKVFESLARALPIVMSSNCLGGYDLKDGQEMLLADSVQEFVEKIIGLSDAGLRQRLSDGAAMLAAMEFSEAKIESVLKNLLKV